MILALVLFSVACVALLISGFRPVAKNPPKKSRIA